MNMGFSDIDLSESDNERISKELQGWPEEALAQAAQDPNPNAQPPQIFAMIELERRSESPVQAPNSTVLQDLLAETQGMQQQGAPQLPPGMGGPAGGLGTMAPPGMPQMSQGPPGMPPGMPPGSGLSSGMPPQGPPGMAAGGLIRGFQHGGSVAKGQRYWQRPGGLATSKEFVDEERWKELQYYRGIAGDPNASDAERSQALKRVQDMESEDASQVDEWKQGEGLVDREKGKGWELPYRDRWGDVIDHTDYSPDYMAQFGSTVHPGRKGKPSPRELAKGEVAMRDRKYEEMRSRGIEPGDPSMRFGYDIAPSPSQSPGSEIPDAAKSLLAEEDLKRQTSLDVLGDMATQMAEPTVQVPFQRGMNPPAPPFDFPQAPGSSPLSEFMAEDEARLNHMNTDAGDSDFDINMQEILKAGGIDALGALQGQAKDTLLNPGGGGAQNTWNESIKKRLDEIAARNVGMSDNERNLLIASHFLDAQSFGKGAAAAAGAVAEANKESRAAQTVQDLSLLGVEANLASQQDLRTHREADLNQRKNEANQSARLAVEKANQLYDLENRKLSETQRQNKVRNILEGANFEQRDAIASVQAGLARDKLKLENFVAKHDVELSKRKVLIDSYTDFMKSYDIAARATEVWEGSSGTKESEERREQYSQDILSKLSGQLGIGSTHSRGRL